MYIFRKYLLLPATILYHFTFPAFISTARNIFLQPITWMILILMSNNCLEIMQMSCLFGSFITFCACSLIIKTLITKQNYDKGFIFYHVRLFNNSFKGIRVETIKFIVYRTKSKHKTFTESMRCYNRLCIYYSVSWRLDKFSAVSTTLKYTFSVSV